MTNYKALLPYAKTDRQRQVLDSLVLEDRGDRKGTLTAVARHLGVSRHTIQDILTTVKKNAARAGYAPESTPAWAQELPEGHRNRGMSTLVDADGATLKQWAKTERAPDPPTRPIVPEGHHITRSATMLDRQGEALIQWVSTDHAAASREASFWEAARSAAAEFTALPPVLNRAQNFQDSLTVYPVGDPHIGLLSWHKETGVDFDTAIAKAELMCATSDLVASSPRSSEAILALMGDNFHADDDMQRTPASGHKLDVDTRSGKVTKLGLELFLGMTLRLLQRHEKVSVIVIPGNHDPKSGMWTRLWLEAMLKDNKRCELVDTSRVYTYRKFGKNLLGFAHGHKARDERLMGIMAHDCGPGGLPGCEDYWGTTFYRRWFEGHLHQDVEKEFAGGKLTRVRTLAARDMYAHEEGFRSGRSLQSFTFDREFGLRHRTECDIRRVKNLLSSSK